MTSAQLLEYMEHRLADLKERLNEARRFGVNTPGFNQTLGALDELQELLRVISEP